MKTQTLAKYF